MNPKHAMNISKAMVSKGYDVQTFTSGFMTQPDYFLLGAMPDAKVRCYKKNQVTFEIAEVKCPYYAHFLKPSEATVLKTIFTTNDSSF